ncbi:hypothetical protein F3Y22_tig00111617pilonHSYRG00036 [Hibiscus syriacus]|uniref:SWIM-type domain-containing protein n=1 Tax=Hibiscus syriacus TaxID=106335 RepID=A0A6A2XJE3_HIBSY|nr:hypothetical protein F3Y22_tig00111617pilonHSYRG00036 [Hibiscus syriacus]
MGKKSKIKKNPWPKHTPRNAAMEQLNIEAKDVISCFPDDILFHIISFLPFESAVHTGFLSRRWKGLWRKTLVLERAMDDAVVTAFNLLYVSVTPDRTHHLDFSACEQEFPASFDWNIEAKDVISCFPDDVLFHIISFLPFESAVHTGFLSRRWKGLWRKTLVLERAMDDAVVTAFNLLYDFDEHNRPKNNWGLQFNLGQGALLFVSVTPDRTVHLDFSAGEQEFPASFDWCNGVQSLVVEDAGVLQKLIVLDCPQLQFLSFQGPRLRCFRYRGDLVSFRFKVCCRCYYATVYSTCDCGLYLEDAMVDLRQGPLTQWTRDFEPTVRPHRGSDGSDSCSCDSKHRCFESILRSINGVKSLTICRWFFEQTMCKSFYSSSGGPELYFSRLKELWWIDCSMARHNINALLCFLKLCPNLERLYVTIDPKCYELSRSSSEKSSSTVSGPANLNGLKVVKLEGFADEEMENLLSRRLIPLDRQINCSGGVLYSPGGRSPCTPGDLLGRHARPATWIGSHTILSTCSCSGEHIPPAPRVIPLTSSQETHACSFDGLRYRFMICPNPVKYAAVPLEEDDDIGTMVRLHELTNIAVIELFVDVHNICDVPGSSREECETRNIPELVVDIDAENRWGEIHDDSSEDEETEEPVLGGDENIFGGGAIDEVPAPYEATLHMYEIDYDAMRAPEFPDMPHLPPYQMTASFDNSGEFLVGVQFRGKNEATLAIKEYCIKCHVDIHVAESNQKTLYAKCVKYGLECKWKIRVSKNQRHDVWVITRYNGPHTCLRNFIEQDHRLLDSDVICEYVKAMVEKDPRISCSVLAASIRSQFGYQVKYGKVWNAKMKAMKLTYGDWDTSYNELPHLLQAMKRFIPGTIVKSQTMPAYDEEGQLLPGKKIFHRLFWAFKACIEGFPFCKRMIQVDGTWLYGQYRHVLLMAVAQDGERNIFPIVFAIVEGETTEAWDFFLTNLRQYVVREDGVCLISDRGTGILAAIERPGSRWIPPYAYPTYCIRHIGKNSIDQFHNAHIRSEIVSMGYELRRPNFDKRLENLKVFYDDQRVWKWASKIPREKWSQAYDEGRRYKHMTTNLAEAINSVLKGTRHLPIASVMKETYFRLGKVWSDKGKEIESLINRGKTWAPTVVESMEANERLATSMVVHNFDRVGHTFVVSCIRRNVGGEDQTFRVDLRHKWCDCGRFQAWKYPCAHAVAACMYAGVSAYTYVDECFHLRRILNVYSYEFRQIPNESYWLRKDHDEWLPNPMLRRSPRVDLSPLVFIPVWISMLERGQTKRCGLCRGEGHSKNNCPNLPRYRPHH